jgi:beta-glucosidase
VARILRTKFELGLFEHPFASLSDVDKVGSPSHRAVARKAAAESQVLLKNDGGALPLDEHANIYVAGRNADNIGNQAGGWTIAWQGISGDIIPGTTILDGIREVAPDATVTYSADASAPTTGADVGVVVVGETPYAEGFGDVGGPECGFCSPAQLEEKSLSLQPGDKAVIDKVCDAIDTCVVLVVSGRPQVLTAQLGKIDALVASWLPGSEGEGVADVLFGARPFTGRLSVTWPRTEAQEPINVGDANYQPLFPFGWGLRTDSMRSRVLAAVKNLGAGERGPAVRAALRLDRTLAGAKGSGATPRSTALLRPLATALVALEGRSARTAAARQAIVSVARDVAQSAVIKHGAPPDWARLIADADHALLRGHTQRAFTLLARVVD